MGFRVCWGTCREGRALPRGRGRVHECVSQWFDLKSNSAPVPRRVFANVLSVVENTLAMHLVAKARELTLDDASILPMYDGILVEKNSILPQHKADFVKLILDYAVTKTTLAFQIELKDIPTDKAHPIEHFDATTRTHKSTGIEWTDASCASYRRRTHT